ncbi:hypothetical protein AJ80_03684 [Polytolypa hystricis UAMH7299]|uniref:Zn(2)-C6 fungal-type domain-containing protein n=1 Tax=Polytolypa hystricis (strain UAMH7299) TaxID=1447883 RepID=A0A2B7YF06_POLH7|nr:hypothetical protein AJ80_03684 [Polytolypa hystricis UAMH7299]
MAGADYPRKRTAIACEICRARRTKCDARKPACSKCMELEVECVYRKPNLWDREPVTAAATAALGKVDSRLDQIQTSISTLAEQVANITKSQASLRLSTEYSSPLAAFSPPENNNSPRIDLLVNQPVQPYQRKPDPPTYGILTSSRSHGHRMPNLLSFVSPASLGPFSYDYANKFFSGEVINGDRLFQSMEECLHMADFPPDFSQQTCWRLQRAFVDGFLKWLPLFGEETCLHHVRIAAASNFSDTNTSTCLSLFIFALGAMALDDRFYHEDPVQLPGFVYLALAQRMLRSLTPFIGDIELLQCQNLFSAYLGFAIRPVQSWNEIGPVARECMITLKTDWRRGDPETTNMKERAFWVAYVMENELSVTLELPQSGILAFHESVPLPTSQVEEEGLYYFLALISIRKLLAEVVDTVGFKAGHALYVPIVAIELRNQIFDWHKALPPSLQFQLDASPLFDLRKAHLRGQLLCLLVVVYWPFVLRHVEDYAKGQQEACNEVTAAERHSVHERAKQCIEYCIMELKAAEGIMMQKTLVSHPAVRAFYSCLVVLLLGYEAVHHCQPPPEIAQLITYAIEVLSMWDVVPFMREPILRVRRFAADLGFTSPGTHGV